MKGKQCPRCKSQLNGKQGMKIVCKKCGYVQRNIEVVKDNQEFQQRHNFGKRITMKASNESYHGGEDGNGQMTQTEFRQHYIVSFQNMLRSAAINISKFNEQYSNIQYYLKYLWINYLTLASQYNIDISGIFKKLILNKNKNNNNQNNKTSQVKDKDNQHDDLDQMKQQQGDVDVQNKYNVLNSESSGNQLSQDQFNNGKQKGNKNGQIQESEQMMYKKRRRGRKKKKQTSQIQSTNQEKRVSLKSQIRRKVIQLEHNQDQLQPIQQANQFLSYLYQVGVNHTTQVINQEFAQQEKQSQLNAQIIEYMANKYCVYLVKNLRLYNLNIGSSYSFVKGRPVKVTIKQLQILIHMRKLKFTQKDQMIIVLMLQDLLKQWAQTIGYPHQTTLQNLLLIYKSPRNTHTNALICQTISHLKKLVTNQSDTKQKNTKNIKFPELSIELLYSLLYIASIISSHTLSIDDIVLYAGQPILYYGKQNKQIVIGQSTNNNRIRKCAGLISRILKLKYEASAVSVGKWVHKYMRICGMGDKQVMVGRKVADVIFNSYMASRRENNENSRNRSNYVVEKRYQFLQQDMIAKAIIIILVKLQLGFDQYPYLSTFPTPIIDILKSNLDCTARDKSKTHNTVQQKNNRYATYITFLEQMNSLRVFDNCCSFSISKIIDNLNNHYGPVPTLTHNKSATSSIYGSQSMSINKHNRGVSRYQQLKIRYRAESYSGLQFMDIQHLIQLHRGGHNKGLGFQLSFSVNLASSVNNKLMVAPLEIVQAPTHRLGQQGKQGHLSNISTQLNNNRSTNTQKMRLSKKFKKQLQYAIKQYDKKDFDYKQLDYACTNYQFFYQYMSNIKHVGRDLFVAFVENLAGSQCKLKELYQWLEQFQRILVQFQN